MKGDRIVTVHVEVTVPNSRTQREDCAWAENFVREKLQSNYIGIVVRSEPQQLKKDYEEK